ncbi:TnsA-like heteromeric transposase endonuclease subunit [Streptomyces sp. 1222.2]|uniref:TnsA-like heteromeric transposase endonuclease subunit n=1 Tax=Streptomyces sp. 1222.2 TaxID=1938833 RepID=UPI000BE4029A|nr:TnsA-like heteromeric transposase endonuclease subunit [Streptomyces sp. 1222.2]
MSQTEGRVSISLRRADGNIDDLQVWSPTSAVQLQSVAPWRTFRWRHGQKHYSGTYWSSTIRSHVIYESRLELTRLLYADFDQSMTTVFAQPFLVSATVKGSLRRHVPDFLFLRDDRVPLVVDVKPRHLLTRPKVAFSLGWARDVFLSRGWDFEVWCEPPQAEMENLRFLAGYRRDWLFDDDVLAEIRQADLYGATLGEAFHAFPNRPAWQVRAAVLRLLWCQHFATDLSTPLSARHQLIEGPATVTGSGMRKLPESLQSEQDPENHEGSPAVRLPLSSTGGRVNGAAVRVGVGARLKYDGEVVVVEEVRGAATGNEILVRDGPGRRFRLALHEVLSSGRAQVIAEEPGPASDDPDDTASVLLAQLSDEELANVRERAAHINEVLYGFRSGTAELAASGEPRPEYVSTIPKMQRYETKAAELNVSVRTIKRWVRAFLLDREAGLIERGPHRAADLGGVGRADPRWVEMALEIMAEHEDQSKPSRAKVIRSIGPRLQARYGKGEVELPTRATAYRWLQELDRRLPTFRLSTKRNRDIAARPGTAYGKLRPTRPGEYLLMDTTRLDVFALDPLTLKWVQAELTIAMDWYTRCITGIRVTPVSTKSIDVAATLFQTYRPRPAGKKWPAHAVWPDHGIPRTVFVDRDALAAPGDDEGGLGGPGTASPALVPETIVVDHGKPYISEHVTSVCQRLGVSVQPARLRTGRDKGPIERFFRTLREGLLELLPGYKGPDLFSRGVNPEGEAFFFLNELEAIIREWVACVYHHRPHRGLVDPRVPGLRLSPATMFEHGIARAGYIEVPRDPDLGFEFLQTVWKPIHHYGVETRKCRYNGPGLDDCRNRTSQYAGPKAKGRWPIHVDPDNINFAYFRHPDTRRWHTLTWEHAPDQDFPISEEAMDLAREMAGKKYRFPDDETAVADLMERWNLGFGLTMSERRIALRLAREQSAFDLPVTDADEINALPSVARVLALDPGEAPSEEQDDEVEPELYEGPSAGDDDEDDELDTQDSAEDFYADALEDA